MSLPDQLALLRIALTPVVMGLILARSDVNHAFGIAAALFVVAAVSDFLDGYLARRWNVSTVLGSFLDSVADKILVTGVLFALVEAGRTWAWAAFVIVAREVTIMGLRGLAALDGTPVPPSILGKVKATVQFLAIGLAMVRLSDPWGPYFLDEWMMIAAVIVTVLSGVEYLSRFRAVAQAAR